MLTDVVLPDRNGRDLAFELVTLGHAFRIIFISGYPENSVTRNGFQKSGWFYLPKPFSAAVAAAKSQRSDERSFTSVTWSGGCEAQSGLVEWASVPLGGMSAGSPASFFGG